MLITVNSGETKLIIVMLSLCVYAMITLRILLVSDYTMNKFETKLKNIFKKRKK